MKTTNDFPGEVFTWKSTQHPHGFCSSDTIRNFCAQPPNSSPCHLGHLDNIPKRQKIKDKETNMHKEKKIFTNWTLAHMGPQLTFLKKWSLLSLMGGPNWPSWEVDHFCLLPEAGRKEPIFCLTVDKREHSILNEIFPKKYLLQVAICDKSYIRDKPLIWDKKHEFGKILSSISKIFG